MIITTLLFLAILSFILIILGFYTDIQDYKILFLLTGFLFFFLTSLQFSISGVDYKIGEIETYIYGDDYDSYHYDDYNGTLMHGTLQLFHKETFDETANYQNRTIGIFSMFLAAFGFALVMYHINEWREDYD